MASDNRNLIVLAVRFCTAMRFLTLIPIAWRAEEDSQQFANSLAFFPIVGVIIGSVAACCWYFLSAFLPQSVVAILSIAYLAFISGCLHLDGLSDSADGLLSSRPKEQCLRIMKDSRAGAMGIVVVVLVLITKYAALSAMAPGTLPVALFLIPFSGRCSILLTMASLPYAREEGGLGRLFYSGNSKKAAIIGIILLIVCVLFVIPGHLLPLLIGFSTVNYLFNIWCKTKIGGATGDTLGAVCELTEMVVAVSLATSFSHIFNS